MPDIDREGKVEVDFTNQPDSGHLTDPDWEDVPDTPNPLKTEVEDAFLTIVPDVLRQGAVRRYAISVELAGQYAKYRKARCSPKKSRREALKRVAEAQEVSRGTVYDHLRSYDETNDDYLQLLTTDLEAAWSDSEFQDETYRKIKTACDTLLPILRILVEIENAPSVQPSDLTLQNIRQDQPGERDRILTPERDVKYIPKSESQDTGASISGGWSEPQNEATEVQTAYLSNDDTVYTRDISLYATEFSALLRRLFTTIQEEMYVTRVITDPVISSDGDDLASVSAVLPHPNEIECPSDRIAKLTIRYWESGDSQVTADINTSSGDGQTAANAHLAGSIDSISEPSIHALFGGAMRMAVSQI